MKKLYIPYFKSFLLVIFFLQFSGTLNAQGTIRGLVYAEPDIKLDAGIVSLFVLENGYYNLHNYMTVNSSDTTLYSYEFNEVPNGTYIVLAAIGQHSQYSSTRQSTYYGGVDGVTQWEQASSISIASDSGMTDSPLIDPILMQATSAPIVNWSGNSSISGSVAFPTMAQARTTEAAGSAIVTLYTATSDRLTSTYTDPSGAYSFDGIAEGSYEIGVEYPGGNSSRTDVTASGATSTAPPIEVTRQTVGIKKATTQIYNLDLYPNPVKDLFNVQINTLQGQGTIRIINASGLEMLKEQLSGTNLLTVDAGFLSPGIYIVEVTNNDSISRTRFTKE